MKKQDIDSVARLIKNQTTTMAREEELKAKYRQLKEKQRVLNQEQTIDRLLKDVEALLEKANKREYVPTDYERRQFERIRIIITNMANWF